MIWAVSGEEALARAEGCPDLILMDICLPGEIDGFEATRRLKADPRFAHIPVIGMTGSFVEEVIAGFDEFIFKPIEVGRLTPMLERLLRRTQQRSPQGSECERSG